MNNKKYKVFILKSGKNIIGVQSEGSRLDKCLQIVVQNFVDPKTKATSSYPVCMPIGFPINTKPVGFNVEYLDVLFEVKDFEPIFKEVYETDLLKIENPHVAQPKTSGIIS